jgi:hypothetical protein
MRRASAWVVVWRGITTVSGLCIVPLAARPALAEAVIALSIMPLVHIQTSASKANH